MDRSVKAPSGSDSDLREAGIVAGLAVGVPALTEVAGAAVWLAPVLGGPAQDVPLGNPFALYNQIFATHELAWTTQATASLVGLGVTGCAACVGAALGSRWLFTRKWSEIFVRKTAHPVDERARYMARGRELSDLHRQAIFDKAAKLRVQLEEGQAPGVLVGRTVADGREIYGSYEDLHLDIWGPRQGKSTSRVIPAVMDAPGAVVATSNKRDVVDATRDPRSKTGRVWVFDPQGVAEEPATWCWDPIAWVYGEDGEGAQERAAELAGHFAAANEGTNGGDAFFEPEGEDLLAGLFLACAMDKKPITQAFAWVTTPDEERPVQILQDNGFELAAGALVDQYKATPKQKSGVFSTAKKMASCLKFDRIRPWVTPGDGREEFTVAEFVRSTDTLYPLSEEGKGNAAPLVTALGGGGGGARRHHRGAPPGPGGGGGGGRGGPPPPNDRGRPPRWPVAGAVDDRAGRGRQHRALEGLAEAVQPLRVSRNRRDDGLAVVGPGCALLGCGRHDRAVVGGQHQGPRLRPRRRQLPARPLRADRRSLRARHLGVQEQRPLVDLGLSHHRTHPHRQ